MHNPDVQITNRAPSELRQTDETAVHSAAAELLPWRCTFFKNTSPVQNCIPSEILYIEGCSESEEALRRERKEECVTERRRKKKVESAPQRERKHKNKINMVTIYCERTVSVTSEHTQNTLVILHLTLK